MKKRVNLILGLAVMSALIEVPSVNNSVMAQGAQAKAPEVSTFGTIMLSTHNTERKSFGAQPLIWSPDLAKDAKRWADELARRNIMQHASHDERGGAGENLWVGTKDYYQPKQMIDAFIDEKQHYKSGKFPDVSSTGNWVDVGHYTQLVWPETRTIGCAVSSNKNDDFLVCRYWPAGNVMGVELQQK